MSELKLVVDDSFHSKVVLAALSIISSKENELCSVVKRPRANKEEVLPKLEGCEQLVHPVAIASHIFKETKKPELIGSENWVTAFHKAFDAHPEEAPAELLKQLETQLEQTMFLCGDFATLVDVFFFAALSALKTPETPALLRWFDLMQHYRNGAVRSALDLSVCDVKRPVSTIFEKFGALKRQAGEGKAREAMRPKRVEEQKEKQNGGGKKKGKKEKKKKEPKPKPVEEPAVYRLNVCVGRVVSAELHPNADRLYVEQVDIGTGEPIQVVSGLKAVLPLEQLVNRTVVLITNTKPAALKGVPSAGRILVGTAEDGSKELLQAPEEAKVGEKVTFPGVNKPADNIVSPKNLSKILKKLHTDKNGVAMFDALPFMTSGGPCVAPSVKGGTLA